MLKENFSFYVTDESDLEEVFNALKEFGILPSEVLPLKEGVYEVQNKKVFLYCSDVYQYRKKGKNLNTYDVKTLLLLLRDSI